jgi:hypothetical protein
MTEISWNSTSTVKIQGEFLLYEIRFTDIPPRYGSMNARPKAQRGSALIEVVLLVALLAVVGIPSLLATGQRINCPLFTTSREIDWAVEYDEPVARTRACGYQLYSFFF